MRRALLVLLALALVVPALAGCNCCTDRCYEVPTMRHVYVVDQCCYPIDEHGRPLTCTPVP